MRIALTAALLLLVLSCSGPEEAGTDASASAPGEPMTTLSVYTVSYPLQYFAERIGGDAVQVHFPIPDGASAAAWTPDAETIARYQSADIILLNGAGFAKWVETVTLPESRLVDTSASFHDDYITVENAVVHSHGPEGEHSHGETASHTWLDPQQAVRQAEAVLDALVKAVPDAEASFRDGFSSLARDLAAIDEGFRAATENKGDSHWLATSTAHAYLARRYGLSVNVVALDPEHTPDDDAWHDVTHVLEDHPSRWALWTREPRAEVADKLLGVDVASVVVATAAEPPATGDFLTVMESNRMAIERALAAGE